MVDKGKITKIFDTLKIQLKSQNIRRFEKSIKFFKYNNDFKEDKKNFYSDIEKTNKNKTKHNNSKRCSNRRKKILEWHLKQKHLIINPNG